MKGRYEFSGLDDYPLTVELTMTAKEWRNIKEALSNMQQVTVFPSDLRYFHALLIGVLGKFREATDSRYVSTPWRTDTEAEAE